MSEISLTSVLEELASDLPSETMNKLLEAIEIDLKKSSQNSKDDTSAQKILENYSKQRKATMKSFGDAEESNEDIILSNSSNGKINLEVLSNTSQMKTMNQDEQTILSMLTERDLIISELEKRNEELESTNRELSAKVVKLNKSDLELKKSQELREEVARLTSTLTDKEKHLNRVNNQLYNLQEELKKRNTEADEREEKLKADKKAFSSKLQEESTKKAERMKKDFIANWGTWLYIIGAYALILNVLLVTYSKTFTTHLKSFLMWWGDLLANGLMWVHNVSYSVSVGIHNTIGSLVMEWLFVILVGVAITLLVIVLLREWLKWFKKNQADRVAFTFSLYSFGAMVFLSDYLSVNTFGIWVLLQIGFMIGRAYLDNRKDTEYD